jgi:hypothetical protein
MFHWKLNKALLTSLALSVVACTNTVPNNNSVSFQYNFRDLDKEYTFTTKALTKSYLKRKLDRWLGLNCGGRAGNDGDRTGGTICYEVNGPMLVKEIAYASYKYPDMFREIMADDQDMLLNINLVTEVATRKQIDSHFNDFLESSIVVMNAISCKDVLEQKPNSSSGVYEIDPDGPDAGAPPFNVLCDMTTDTGGWTLVAHTQTVYDMLSSTGAMNEASLINLNSNAKLSDSVIKQLALSGNRELLIKKFYTDDPNDSDDNNERYIERYSDTEWNTWAADGATNLVFDSKGSTGTWQPDVCNGHSFNRGFSTYSDFHGMSCPVIFQGAPFYYRSNHTTTPNGELASVYIR